MTLPPLQVERPRSTIHGWTRVLWTVRALQSLTLLTASASARRRMEACRVMLNHPILKSTYLLLHLVRFVHQHSVLMHLSPEPSVFLVDEGGVDPQCPQIFTEQDEDVCMGIGFGFVRAKSGRRMGWLLVHQIPLPHSPPHHRFVVHSVFDKACGVKAALMAHFHGAEVGRYVVLKPGGASDNGGIMHYAAYLRAAHPPHPSLRSLSSASTSLPSSPSRRRFFTPGCDSSICLDEGVLTWSLKVPQVMRGRLDKRSFTRVLELLKGIGDVGDDEAAWRGLQGLDMAFAVLEKLAALFMSLTMSVTPLDSEGGMKPTRITLRSFTLHSAASLALLFISVRVSNQKHCHCASVFALAWRSCSSAHLLAVVFGTGTPDACSRRKVKGLGTVRRNLPWRGSGEDCPGFAEFIVNKGREELAVSKVGLIRNPHPLL